MTSRTRLAVLVVALSWQACGGPDELSLCAGQDSPFSAVTIPLLFEPGQPMVISGRVLVGRQRRPLPGTRLLIYHTNAAGKYARDDSGYLGAYLCGVLRTDAEGRYRIDTIRPGSRNGRTGEHIHFDIRVPWGDRYFDSVSFADDPRMRDYPAGERWEEVRPVRHGPDGVQYVERDFWIRY